MSEHSPENTPQRLRTALAEVRADVLGALEPGVTPTLKEVSDLRRSVEDAVEAYNRLLGATPEAERAAMERTLGRQVVDLRRTAALLPQSASGTTAQHSQDKLPSGGQPFIETRPPPRSSTSSAAPARARGHSPGGEVEGWCGPCGGLRTHNIIAVVDGQPRQVLCQSCGGRHGYRMTPARATAEGDRPRAPIPIKMKKTPEQLQEQRRQEENQRLRQELAAATDVQPFDPRRRYKAGQIIDHPEHGRGKIENIVRSSILVRFPTGLRSLVLK